ncbi:MAG: glycosyltransferase family 4 protein [Geobacteraceae bacterium]|nr:glycosyltransferase family 4 protein [Geobacteraceae bacterium]
MTDGKLRILMLAPTPFFSDRGCHVRIFEEARALIRRGHEVRLVTYHLGRDMPGIPTCRIPPVPWYRKLAAGPSWHKPYLDILLFCKALSEVRRFRPNLIYAHLHEGALLGVFLKMIFRIPLLFDCQGSLTTEIVDHDFVRPGSLPYRLFRSIEGFVNGRADLILTSSGPAARDLIERWGVPAARVRALMDGVDTGQFQPYPGEEVRRELNLPSGVPVAVFLGVLNRYQGIDILLEVVKIFQRRGTPLHFLVMGFPHQQYQQRAINEGISGRITFTGRIDYRDAPRLLAAGDVALSPKVSLSEANGKLFNYMACGIPVLAFDTPINREILGDAGVYARFGDAADFAARLEELVLQDGLRRELAEQVRTEVVARHSWAARGRELEDACREAAAR